MQLTQDRLLTQLEQELEHDPSDDGLWHMAHTQCQDSRATVLTICGRELPWATLVIVDGPAKCGPCWLPAVVCPHCGALLRNVMP